MTPAERALKDAESEIGTELGVSSWIEVDQKMIDQFADVTHDHQWIHLDADRAARETPFGGTIAHGFLTLSLASSFIYEVMKPMPGQVMGVNYGLNKLRFLSPVKAGSRIRGRFTLTALKPRSDTQLLRETALTVEIEGSDTPAMIADWLGLAVFAEA